MPPLANQESIKNALPPKKSADFVTPAPTPTSQETLLRRSKEQARQPNINQTILRGIGAAADRVGGSRRQANGLPQSPTALGRQGARILGNAAKASADTQQSGNISERLSRLRGQARAQSATKSKAAGLAETAINTGIKMGTGKALTSMWSAVWLDWTCLTLLGLNLYFATTLFTDRIAAFGEDSLFGLALGKDLGKWVEIFLLALLDVFVATIIIGIVYLIFKLVSCPWYNVIQTVTFWDITACFQ